MVHPLLLTILVAAIVLLSSSDGWGARTKKVPSLCKISYPSDAAVAWDCHRIRTGETLERLFGDQWTDVARFNRIDRRHTYPGVSIKVPKDLKDIAAFSPLPGEYPEAAQEAKFILIDLAEQFLGAYEYGHLAFSSPIASGEKDNKTPSGEFRINAADPTHSSSLYTIEDTDILYPMHYALRFYINKRDTSFWIHGRDLPGYPASHGCIGLYDEEMQKKYYHFPKDPVLVDAKNLYLWVTSSLETNGSFFPVDEGPRVLIIGARDQWGQIRLINQSNLTPLIPGVLAKTPGVDIGLTEPLPSVDNNNHVA